MRTDRDGAPLASVDAEDAAQQHADAEGGSVAVTDWNLYRQLERLLAREFRVDLVSRDGIAIRDLDDRELWVTAKEMPA